MVVKSVLQWLDMEDQQINMTQGDRDVMEEEVDTEVTVIEVVEITEIEIMIDADHLAEGQDHLLADTPEVVLAHHVIISAHDHHLPEGEVPLHVEDHDPDHSTINL